MKKEEVKIGSFYQMAVNGKKGTVRLDNIEVEKTKKHGGYKYDGSPKPQKTSKRTIYVCHHLELNRVINFKSASKFQCEVENPNN